MIRILLYILSTPFILALAITPNLVEMGLYTDKVLHLFFFCMATLFLTLTQNKSTSQLAIYAIILVSLGAGIELLQSLTPSREAQLGDMIANISGIILGFTIRYLLRSGYYAGTVNQ